MEQEPAFPEFARSLWVTAASMLVTCSHRQQGLPRAYAEAFLPSRELPPSKHPDIIRRHSFNCPASPPREFFCPVSKRLMVRGPGCACSGHMHRRLVC